VSPDLVLTHAGHDRHQDHRFVSELTWNHFRAQLVLEYEIPKYDGDLGQPNFFVPVTREDCERKASDILEAFASQRAKDWLSTDTVLALARLRGVECRSPTGYAEAFFVRKAVLE
jgi:LmbE family N-acetylglucosaminyl deacetylase